MHVLGGLKSHCNVIGIYRLVPLEMRRSMIRTVEKKSYTRNATLANAVGGIVVSEGKGKKSVFGVYC